MPRKPQLPIEQTEQPGPPGDEWYDDGKSCSFEFVDGVLVETVTQPARADRPPAVTPTKRR